MFNKQHLSFSSKKNNFWNRKPDDDFKNKKPEDDDD
jgi:hypothetical protein